ncbi:MAG: tRNA pseudouridine(54/55) synthase Pus10 [Candidatus Diapherotrites archaeon]
MARDGRILVYSPSFVWKKGSLSSEGADFLLSFEWRSFSVGVISSISEEKKIVRNHWCAFLSNNPSFRDRFFVQDEGDIHVVIDFGKDSVFFRIHPIILVGRYLKLARGIAQTRHYCYSCKGVGKKKGKLCFVCNGEKILTKESVQELIAPFVKEVFQCEEVLFHGAGREDVDVRMLGNGRPFALTLENPRVRIVDVLQLMKKINHALLGKVELIELQLGVSRDVARIMQTYHTKKYRALVESLEKISIRKLDSFLHQKIDVIQTTPSRVEKRRAMKERFHWVVLEKVTQIDSHHIEMELHASQGCYIKEFISGDNGRSVPSFSSWLASPCTCIELDVLAILDESLF